MKKGLFKKAGLLLSCCILSLTVGSGSVYATSESNHTTKTVNGKTYEYYSDVDAYSNDVRCGTYIGANSRINAGYIAALPRAYDENGDLVATGDWSYNDEKTVGMNVCIYPGNKGSYYSYGKVKIYNGDGYNTYTTNKSPIVSSKNRSTLSYEKNNNDEAYKKNNNDETYGSGLQEIYLGTMPDLVRAHGMDGTIGYVRSEDIQSEDFNTPKENDQYKNNNSKIISLYDVDGQTVIGKFEIQKTEVELIK